MNLTNYNIFLIHSSYALENKNEVIEVLLTQEELLIDSSGRDQETMLVDPFQTSVEEVKIFIENKMKIPADKQGIFYDQENMCDANSPSLSDVFLKAKQKPIFKVYTNRTINITVLQPPNEKKQEVEMMLFDTVDKLKQKLEEGDICSRQHMLKFSGADLGDGRKQLVGLGIKNKSEIVIQPLKRSTHRGFSSAAIRYLNFPKLSYSVAMVYLEHFPLRNDNWQNPVPNIYAALLCVI